MKNESKATRDAAIVTLWVLDIMGLVALDSKHSDYLPIQYYILFYAIPLGIYILGRNGYYLVCPTIRKGDIR